MPPGARLTACFMMLNCVSPFDASGFLDIFWLTARMSRKRMAEMNVAVSSSFAKDSFHVRKNVKASWDRARKGAGGDGGGRARGGGRCGHVTPGTCGPLLLRTKKLLVICVPVAMYTYSNRSVP